MPFQAKNTRNVVILEATKLIIVIFSVESSKITRSMSVMRLMQKYYQKDVFSGLKYIKCCYFRSYEPYFCYCICRIFRNYTIYKCYDMQKYYKKDASSGLKHVKFCDCSSYNGYFRYSFRRIIRNNMISEWYEVDAINYKKKSFSGLKHLKCWYYTAQIVF